MPAPTFYDVLGVAPSADGAEIREAYRRLAREHHPDRARTSRAGEEGASMPTINEAYRVLGDPARRAVYDAGLRTGAGRGPAAAATGGTNGAPSAAPSPNATFPSHLGPARIPWRSLLFFGALAIVGVVVLAQFTEPAAPRGPDGIIEVGSCVAIEANGDAREVSCTSDPAVDLVVAAFVPFDGACPGGSVAHRDRQGMGVACVVSSGDVADAAG